MLATRQVTGNDTAGCCFYFICFNCFPPINVLMVCSQRGKVRTAFNIKGSCLEDLLLSLLCHDCVVAQNTLEVQSRLLQNQVRVTPQMPKGNQIVVVQAVPVGAPEAVSMIR